LIVTALLILEIYFGSQLDIETFISSEHVITWYSAAMLELADTLRLLRPLDSSGLQELRLALLGLLGAHQGTLFRLLLIYDAILLCNLPIRLLFIQI